MVTYDEFMKDNKKVKILKELYLGNERKESFFDSINEERARILGNPLEYLDVAQRATELEGIEINTTDIQDRKWYEAVRRFVANCKEDIKIYNIPIGACTKEEFFNAENIIEGIVDQMDPKWSVKQKLAFVHFKMGELVTYMADYPSNSKPPTTQYIANARNIWKSLTSGISVCNGITYIQRAILSRVGVTTRQLSSGTHNFMLTETEDGNVITDATWDLEFTTFGCKPQYFGKTYEEFRKIDGDKSNAHKLEEPPINVISISDEELREIYYSIGIIGKDRKFDSKVNEIITEMKSREFSSQEERTGRVWELIEEKLGDKFAHIEECKSMFENCLRWHGVDLQNLTSQYLYALDDSEFMSPKLVINIKENNNTSSTKIIDPKGNRVLDISAEELQANYRYHKNNTQPPFWENQIREAQGVEREEGHEYKS